MRLFAVTEAHYVDEIGELQKIAGVPELGYKYFGEYTGNYPYQAASKAFTGLQKHMNKFHKTGKWFHDYDHDHPPDIVFTMQDVESMESRKYHGHRIPAHQGDREIVGSSGRVRHYRWESKVRQIRDNQ